VNKSTFLLFYYALSLTYRFKRDILCLGGENMRSQSTTDYPKISLKAARVNARMTQEQAAKALGISKSTLQSYEKGLTVPNWEMVDRIECVYNYPSSFIFFGKNIA
jgi:DNA-binding XRE family transcriptional regulator